MDRPMTAKEVYDNIKGYINYDIEDYRLCERESVIVKKALLYYIENSGDERNAESAVQA